MGVVAAGFCPGERGERRAAGGRRGQVQAALRTRARWQAGGGVVVGGGEQRCRRGVGEQTRRAQLRNFMGGFAAKPDPGCRSRRALGFVQATRPRLGPSNVPSSQLNPDQTLPVSTPRTTSGHPPTSQGTLISHPHTGSPSLHPPPASFIWESSAHAGNLCLLQTIARPSLASSRSMSR